VQGYWALIYRGRVKWPRLCLSLLSLFRALLHRYKAPLQRYRELFHKDRDFFAER